MLIRTAGPGVDFQVRETRCLRHFETDIDQAGWHDPGRVPALDSMFCNACGPYI
jgi:hypothetical protein